ncbi:MAG TPA: hypothetical protein VEP90_01215 [Methylomirabilota bacterium]|nr:hypothetical protein [Methylomirabilota bacterium]
MGKLEDVQAAVANNDPPIEVNQEWAAFNDNGNVIRKVRILAKHPDQDYWIVEDLKSKLIPYSIGMTKIPEFNLRYVMQLYREVQ